VDHFDPRRPETTKTTIDGSPFFQETPESIVSAALQAKLEHPDP